MKIQIDTKNKVITIDEKVELAELFRFLHDTFPGGKWKEFSLAPVVKTTVLPGSSPFNTPGKVRPNPYDRPPLVTTYNGPNIRELKSSGDFRDADNRESQQEYFGTNK